MPAINENDVSVSVRGSGASGKYTVSISSDLLPESKGLKMSVLRVNKRIYFTISENGDKALDYRGDRAYAYFSFLSFRNTFDEMVGDYGLKQKFIDGDRLFYFERMNEDGVQARHMD